MPSAAEDTDASPMEETPSTGAPSAGEDALHACTSSPPMRSRSSIPLLSVFSVYGQRVYVCLQIWTRRHVAYRSPLAIRILGKQTGSYNIVLTSPISRSTNVGINRMAANLPDKTKKK